MINFAFTRNFQHKALIDFFLTYGRLYIVWMKLRTNFITIIIINHKSIPVSPKVECCWISKFKLMYICKQSFTLLRNNFHFWKHTRAWTAMPLRQHTSWSLLLYMRRMPVREASQLMSYTSRRLYLSRFIRPLFTTT